MPTTNTTTARARWHLVLCSGTILFVELALILWIPAYIRAMGFFTNFVLLGSFLGIGVGILQARRRIDLLAFFPAALAVLVGVIGTFKLEISISPSSQEYFFGVVAHGTEPAFVVPLVFALVTALFACVGQALGRLLSMVRPPLTAYTLDVAGSIAGAALFALVSFLGTEPAFWFASGALALLALPQPGGLVRRINTAILAVVVVWVGLLGHGSVWSPYYRIDLHRNPYHSITLVVNNGINYQAMGPFALRRYFAHYDVPFRTVHVPPSTRELIIGAGTGTDADVALHQGIRHITAVELDPTIYALGRHLNPDRPYQSPAVHVVIDDGRAFLERTHDTYDLIIFAATDSLALTSSVANLRSESYLFTREAFAAARRHLSRHGLLVLYNFYRQPWIVHKLAGMLTHVFAGQVPYGRIFAAGTAEAILMDGPALRAVPAAVYAAHRISPAPTLVDATDDWPFLYLREQTVPAVYLQALALVALLAAAAIGCSVPRATLRRLDPALFCTGLAFLLLEAKSIVAFMLLFGVTWLVNALVIVGILGTVLVANWINARTRLRLDIRLLYLGLGATLALNLLLPLHSLLLPDLALRYGLGCVVLFSPILLANLIFGRLFGETLSPDVAFASNLLGAFVGGALEYAALAVGYHRLLVLVAVAYGLSMVAVPYARGRAGDSGGRVPAPAR